MTMPIFLNVYEPHDPKVDVVILVNAVSGLKLVLSLHPHQQ
jgi:hypothetical protein